MKNKSNIIWGILFIIAGLIWGINASGIAHINIFFDGWWSLFIIIPSVVSFIKNPKDISSVVWCLIGVALLLGANDIISFELIGKMIVPVVFVAIGLGIIFKDKTDEKVKDEIAKIDKDGTEIYAATFSENNIKLREDEFKNAELNAEFGGLTLDITECNITKNMTIKATSIFGGITIKVPNNVNVKVKSTGIFGGTSNRTKYSADNANTIFIDSTAVFGGVDII